MSRLRSTIDSVTRAVGSTDLISKFSRFKPANTTVDGTHAGKVLIKAETLTSSDTASKSPKATKEGKADGKKGDAEEAGKHFVASKKSSSSDSSASVSAPSSSSAVAKQTKQLFQPAALSTNMDETYKSLSHHINSYFGTNGQGEDGEKQLKNKDDLLPEPHTDTLRSVDHIPVLCPVSETKSTEPPESLVPSSSSGKPKPESPCSAESTTQSIPEPTASQRKGFTHYLSYPRPSVQAFVGSYIAPLVPKFRGDSKRVTADKEKSSAIAMDDPTQNGVTERRESEEEKTEKAKQQLQTQREKVADSNTTSCDSANQFHFICFCVADNSESECG